VGFRVRFVGFRVELLNGNHDSQVCAATSQTCTP
jgi:hypothetical protein